MSIGHLYVVFEEVSIQVLCPFFNWIDPSHFWEYIKKPKTLIWKNLSTPIFIAALFTTAKIWKQPKSPSADEWIKQLQNIYAMEYYLAVKKEENFTLYDSSDGPGWTLCLMK